MSPRRLRAMRPAPSRRNLRLDRLAGAFATGCALLITGGALASIGVTSGPDWTPLDAAPALSYALLGIVSFVSTAHASDRGHVRWLLVLPISYAALTCLHVLLPGDTLPPAASPGAGIATLALGIGMLIDPRSKLRSRIVDVCAFVAFAVGTQALAGHAMDSAPLLASDRHMSAVDAALTMLLAAVLVLEDRRCGVGALLVSDGPGGRALRMLLPIGLIVPAASEWMWQYGSRRDLFSPELAQAFDITALMLIGMFAFAFCARQLDAAEWRLRRAREQAFLEVLSHDLRTPLIAIRNLSQLVDERWNDIAESDRRTSLQTVSTQATRLLGLVHDATLLSRLESGTALAEPTQVLLEPVIKAAAASGDVDLVLSCPPDATAWVDPNHVRLLLEMLLVNAHVHGAPPITMQVSSRDAGAFVDLVLADAGPGLDATQQARLLATAPLNVEAGIGLWIAPKLARLADGSLRYEQPAQGGSRFIITLPATKPRQGA